MPEHLLKSKIVRSKKWREVQDDFARLTYCLLVASVDSWGMMPADGISLKAALGTWDDHTPQDYEGALQSLTSTGLVASWTHQGDPWLYVVGHDEEQKRGIRKRKQQPEVPRPDWVMDWGGTSTVLPASSREKNRYEVEVETEVEEEGEEKIQPAPPLSVPSIGECLPYSFMPNSKGDNYDQLEILELRNVAKEVRGMDMLPPDPTHDTRRRIMDALSHLGLEECKRAIRGHWQECRKDGSQLGRGTWHWCPPADIGGQRATNRANIDRVADFAAACGTRTPSKRYIEREDGIWEYDEATGEERRVK